MKTNLRKIIVGALQTYGLAVVIGLATQGTAFAQPVSATFTRITTGAVVTNPGVSFAGAWGDYNNDGFEDLFVPTFDGKNDYLYRNNGDGTFTSILEGDIVNDRAYSQDAVWGDYDNDGYLDLLVTVGTLSGSRANLLYRNQGNGTFTKITSDAIVTNLHFAAIGSSWGDYDNDGYIDLFVAITALSPTRNALYRNSGTGGFIRIRSGALVNDLGQFQSCSWGDYNNDGKLDLFVANIGNSFLYRGENTGVFTNIAVHDGGNSASGSWGDYNNDGFPDLFVAREGEIPKTNFLYRNSGTGIFERVTTSVLEGESGWYSSSAWGDYDNDGFLDLFVTEYQPGNNLLYRNNGDGTFSKVTAGGPVNDGGDSAGCAWADYNNDGFLDLFVANYGAGQTNFLYRNEGNSNYWLKIKCVGGASNRAAIGAKVRVQAENGGGELIWQLREISGGKGLGQNSLIAHFGLGNATNVQTVRIDWPSGIVQTLTNVATKQFLTITEPPLLQAGLSQGNFELRLTGGVGFRYALETSSDLTAWTPLMTVTNTSRTMVVSDPSTPIAGNRFYRAAMLP